MLIIYQQNAEYQLATRVFCINNDLYVSPLGLLACWLVGSSLDVMESGGFISLIKSIKHIYSDSAIYR